MLTNTFLRAASLLPLTLLASAMAMAVEQPTTDAGSPENTKVLPGVEVHAHADTRRDIHFPATQATIPAKRVQVTINAVDVEDAVKYLPSVFLRKRNYGDTQAVLATRTWGVNSSARTLVYLDDIPISALVANNNTLGAPRWGITSPEVIDHIDMLYGPFSAEYAGNSMGGVMHIITRMPAQTEVTLKQTEAVQDYDLYATHGHFSTSQTSATAGGRSGNFGWFMAADLANSFSQPLALITSSDTPAATTGTIPARNKLGAVANVLGAGGLLHTRMLSLNGKFTYDLTPSLQATYLIGRWSNHGQSRTDTYLTDSADLPTYANAARFASNTYELSAHHLMQALSLKSDTQGSFDGEAVITHYAFLKDDQWSPATVTADTGLATNGRLASNGGTNWSTVDLKGIWRPGGNDSTQEISAGVHGDRYELENPTRNLGNWRDPRTVGRLFSAGNGKTTTRALWLQDSWRLAPDWLLTAGGRYEWWRASDGFNFSGNTAVQQPTEHANAFSPKATLEWDVNPDWRLTGSLARAVRFPTVGELYQLVATGPTFSTPNPDLAPEKVRSGELAIDRALDQGFVRLTFFQENTRDALVAQTSTLPGVQVPVTFTMNVGELRNRGVELVAEQDNVLLRGLRLSGNVTFVDSTILANDSFVSPTGTTSTGKHAPYVPRWRATAVATYQPNENWAFTLAGRYSGRQYSTLDNTDNTSNVYGSFDKFLVFDTRLHYQINEHWSASVGVDNLTNEKYVLFHPFPQRTYVADLKVRL